MAHKTVLKEEAITALALTPSSSVVDCTLGAGGHARRILDVLNESGQFIGFDRDASSIASNQELLNAKAQVELIEANFAKIKSELTKRSVTPTAILADLGWRSEQFEGGGKGFSFLHDEPLLMTYGDPEQYDFTARDIVNEWDESSIADIVFHYGEERSARRITSAIVTARETAPIETSTQLADLITQAVPPFRRRQRIHPATKTFQALRIAVNDELSVLKTLLEDGFDLLAPGGRMAIITFHSLEDRIVKQYFKSLAGEGLGELPHRKPVTANEEELAENPRARSAKLRTIEKQHVS